MRQGENKGVCGGILGWATALCWPAVLQNQGGGY